MLYYLYINRWSTLYCQDVVDCVLDNLMDLLLVFFIQFQNEVREAKLIDDL